MKINYLHLIPFILFISCSEQDPPEVENKKPIVEEVIEDKEEPQEYNIWGQWKFSTTQGTKSAYVNHHNSSGDSTTNICEIRSVIFRQDSTFVLYTDDYALFGEFAISDSVITLSIEDNVIGEIFDFEFNKGGTYLAGSFDFSNLCVSVNEGYKEENYYENLTYIPDDNLEKFLVEKGYDDIMDDYVLTSNLESVMSISVEAEDLGYVDGEWQNLYGDDRFKNRIENLSGVEAFKSLLDIHLSGNKLDSINISQNSKLKIFGGKFNEFKKVDTRNNPDLEIFALDNNEGTVLDFTYNHKLRILDVSNVKLDELDLSNNSELTYLGIGGNNLTSIDLSNLINLKQLSSGTNKLSEIDLSNNVNLETVLLMSNKLTSIDLTKLTKLKELSIGGNQLTDIDLSNNLELELLEIAGNNFTSVDISMLNNLKIIEIGNQNMKCIQVNQHQYDLFQSGEWKNPWNVPFSIEPCEL